MRTQPTVHTMVKWVPLPEDRKADYLIGMRLLAEMLHEIKDKAIAAGTWPIKVDETQPIKK